MSILVVAEHDNSALNARYPIAVVTAAKAISDDIHILVIGSDCGGAAKDAARIEGATRVLVADNASYEHQLAENTSLLIAELGKNHSRHTGSCHNHRQEHHAEGCCTVGCGPDF